MCCCLMGLIFWTAGPVQAFKPALISKKRAYGLRFVSVGGQALRACCGLGLTPNAKAELSQAHSKTLRDLLCPVALAWRLP